MIFSCVCPAGQQFYDTANYYYNRYSIDSALIYYRLFINMHEKDTAMKQQEQIVNALNNSSVLYYHMSEYRKAYELLMKALDLSETCHFSRAKCVAYVNIGNIYTKFNEFDMAESWYLKALSLCRSSTDSIVIFNNIGEAALNGGKLDSAFRSLNKSIQISRQNNNAYAYILMNTIASAYRKSRMYDSAFYYYRKSLDESKKLSNTRLEVENLSKLGGLFLEIGITDSVQYYINMANAVAKRNSYHNVMADNYLTLSVMEELKGRTVNAFEYFKKYACLKDSILNHHVLGDINQLQRSYEVAEINRKIEHFIIEKQIKDHIIYYQKSLLFIIIVVLLLVSGGLLVVFSQKIKLNNAYQMLFEKNLNMIKSHEVALEKYQKNMLAENVQQGLLSKILSVMEDASVYCNADFSLDTLVELTQSNRTYVSQAINVALKKNFHSFLQSYRIKAAQQLFSVPDAAKYTIEYVAQQVGYKSPSAFRVAFKEITGVTPVFYLKEMTKQEV